MAGDRFGTGTFSVVLELNTQSPRSSMTQMKKSLLPWKL